VLPDAFSDKAKLWLPAGGVDSLAFLAPLQKAEAPETTVERELTADVEHDEPHIRAERIAYDLVEQIYNWFGHQTPVMPYANHDTREIDPGSFDRR